MVITVKVGDVYYYEFLSETTGMEIRNEYEFIKIMGELAKKKKEYEEVGEALAAVKQRGYGVVTPTKEEIVLEEPQIVKHGSKYGVKIKASAPSIHDPCKYFNGDRSDRWGRISGKRSDGLY